MSACAASAALVGVAALIAAVAFAADRISVIRARQPWARSSKPDTWTLAELDNYAGPDGVIDL